MYKDIIHFLDERRLNEALTQLSAFIESNDNWQLRTELETLSATYGYMKQYASQGMKDPSRSEMFDDLLNKTYTLADMVRIISESKKHSSEYCKAINAKTNYHSFKELAEIIDLNDINAHTKAFADGKISNDELNDIRKKNEEATDEIFLKAWTSLKWNENDVSDAECILNTAGLPSTIIATFISGLTLSLLKIFDEKKFIFLVSVCQNRSDLIVSQRALTGVLLTTYFQESRFKSHHNCIAALKTLADSPTALGQIHDIQMLLLLSRETEKIDKRMREEIIPQMMKNTKLMDPNFKIEDLEDLEDVNPEWNSGKEKFTEKIKELSELQMEGADTYMSTFSQLKHYPFFNKTAHWFYPFDKNNSSVANVLEKGKEGKKTFLSMLLDTPIFCNSDKYSFLLTLGSLNNSGMNMLNSDLIEQNLAMKQESSFARFKTEEETSLNVSRQYIQDLYRFYKLWMYRSENNDIFKDELTLWKNPHLHDLVLANGYRKLIADYLFNKEYMLEASELYEELSTVEALDADTLQKLGFCYQKMKDYPKAIAAYKQADIIKTDNYWTMKHLAICYKRMENYTEALDYFNRLIEQRPEDLNILLQTGQCLAILERYEEALNHFYKVEYLGKSTENAQRAIGWCYFMSGKYDRAIDIYNKIIENSKPQTNDWLNAGHAYHATGNVTKAIEYYRQAQNLCATHDEFMKIYIADKEALLKQGIAENDIYIMADIL